MSNDLSWRDKLVTLVVMGGGVFVVGTTYNRCESRKAMVHLVNMTELSSMSFVLDGETVATDVPSMLEEDAGGVKTVAVKKGHHTLEARGPDGELVLGIEFEESKGTDAYVFAPNPERDSCLVVDTASYATSGRSGLPSRHEVLPHTDAMHGLPDPIDDWFTEHPAAFTVVQGQDYALHTTAWVEPCATAR